MNLHEYQGKELLNSFGVRIQRGIVADNPKKAVEAAKQLATETGSILLNRLNPHPGVETL